VKHLLLASAALAASAALPLTAFAQDDATADFPIAAWSRTAAASEVSGTLEQRGQAVFNNWCDACHRDSDRNAPGTTSLAFKYRGELPAALEKREDLTAELVALYVRNGIATMPFYRPTEISDDDLMALAEYLVKP
jgi:cytochrome c5